MHHDSQLSWVVTWLRAVRSKVGYLLLGFIPDAIYLSRGIENILCSDQGYGTEVWGDPDFYVESGI